jgi:flagellin-like protein
MSDKRSKFGRRLRYRRLHSQKKAVSPVVATLILILVAVAAAAALYLWLVAWQGGVTHGIGSPSAQYTVSIGGSTSVYPMAELAATQFEQNNSDVVVSVNQGGSGAGMAAVCSGQVDIGEASAFYSAQTLVDSDACPATLNEQIIAYDGVDAIVPTANTHGVQNMSWDTLQAIYEDASSTAPTSGIVSGSGYLGGNYHFDGYPAAIDPAQGSSYSWGEIPACAASAVGTGGCAGLSGTTDFQPIVADTETVIATGTTTSLTCAVGTQTVTEKIEASLPAITGSNSLPQGVYNIEAAPTFAACTTAGSETLDSAVAITNSNWEYSSAVTTSYIFANVTFTALGSATAAGTSTVTPAVLDYAGQGTGVLKTGGSSCGAKYPNDICVASNTTASPCGFTACLGTNATIQTVYRSDVSGTQQSFLARLLAVGTANSGGVLNVGFSGCGGDNQWDGCGMSLSTSNSHGEDGNPAVISEVAATPNAIGFASDGLVQTSGSGVSPINFQGFGQSVVVNIQGESTALKTIAAGISDYDSSSASYATAQAYIGWRPFLNVETSTPTGEVLRYLEFVMDPANNENLAAEANEISVYASGLAGVVPVTPVTGYFVPPAP